MGQWTPNFLTSNQTITLSGDVTGSGSTSITTTISTNAVTTAKIANTAVTFAKFQNINTNRLLGRSSAGSGSVEEISIGSGLSLSGGTLSASGGAGIMFGWFKVPEYKLQQTWKIYITSVK